MSGIDRETLQGQIEWLSEMPAGESLPETAAEVVEDLLDGLESGELRAAEQLESGAWEAVPWVKRGILLAFRLGVVAPTVGTEGGVPEGERAAFFDKHTLPLRRFLKSDGVRIVPGGSAVRRGAHLAPGVVCMPPMYVNVGAYVDRGTMIDSHALVGSCAQVGQRVHLSAAAQLGGVLEPAGAVPVVIEDDVFIGGGCGIYEGCIVRAGAVLASGVILTGATRLYDLVHERVITRQGTDPLEVPEGAVVVPGARSAGSGFAGEHGLSLYAPVIVKYRDASTDAATTLEDALR
ncbi:MAG: 2,3,4,5-tetrahydropyridine-2,6-dicarboxylate N-succinyltransferase [Rhodothermales bacterium]|nr:2,3,4,5-tetrahydropyridine-2,6-dicarboxylate N-succinyltransferase [Rhodothermales bacterium]